MKDHPSTKNESKYEDSMIEDSIHRIEIVNGIIEGTYHPSLEKINLEIAKKLVTDRKKISKGKTYPVFVNLGKFVEMDKDARDFMACDESTKGLSAMAILFSNWLHRSAGNLWLLINKPKIPTKLFSSKKDALDWLEQFKEERMN